MDNVIHRQGQAGMNICGCGKLHFTYGPITLHFSREEFQVFAEVVGRLAAQVPDIEDHPDLVTRAPRIETICH
ncbi:MAG: hypothetical protein NNA22_11425 [Nitrospira sp.]|nr:hypothetical protein [Nitrospira sp.]